MKTHPSDGTIEVIKRAIQMGGSVTAVYAILAEAGILAGSLSNPVTEPIAAAITFYMGWIVIENDGCGVIVHTDVTASGYQINTSSSQ